ncbi:SusD-like starch-binding protein associating with outer membrane [Winogradskyella pacifica]|uniref:SusD-like starch-binding protein associating with outer membrane n=1 Tax=Winogradskyella pacifica TaxID=664642 RepID=A0A3D9LK99_9FLAO|nr:RagB/SusD family nutrient uptake outer membrane protein [Winogradskyella pacifica]REE07798.1 SusD-like starch-binding protein associating with outer membrane [Winogradskyella pacifica]
MKPIENLNHIFNTLLWGTFIFLTLLHTSCEDFTEIDSPNNQLIGIQVFEDASTVDAAFAHIYSQLRDVAFTSGNTSGLSYLMGHFTDELTLYSNSQPDVQNYSNNTLISSDGKANTLWSSGYNLIYASNRILEGVTHSSALSQADKDRFLGEAYFVRAFIHFNLMNLFGAIPYITSTDYQINKNVSRLDTEVIYQSLIADLQLAKTLLPETDTSYNKLRPNFWVAAALLAKVYLYHEDWQLAHTEATDVISNGGYVLSTDLSQVFLKTSTATLWQLGEGTAGTNTLDAFTFIFASGPPPNSALSSYLIADFEDGDSRFTNWTGVISEEENTWYYPYKYKLNSPTGNTEECTILFRLAELYLIAAEAYAHDENISEALNYLNPIRTRALLDPITTSDLDVLLNAIYQERRIELFTEQGHRFFDLKRTGRTFTELAPIKPHWEPSDTLLPIPESELLLNTNLNPQNDGY